MRILLSFASFILTLGLLHAEPEYPLTEDSKPQANVPKGEQIKEVYKAKEHNSVFPGTEREYILYVPADADRSKPLPFMVFQDGPVYNAPVVFDNLIASKAIPPMLGLFVKPGVVPATNDNALPRYNRSYEYDSVSDHYAAFILDEMLPALEKKHGVKFSTDANDGGLVGSSSGGIAAFVAAWHRPDRFRRVYTGVGTYVGLRGGDELTTFVRKTEPKPLKIFLQDGSTDLNIYAGDWWMANQMMERSLTWAGYEVNHAWGEGGHNHKHASQVMPEALRWLWSDWQTSKEVKANAKAESQWKGYEIFEKESQWELVTKDRKQLFGTAHSSLVPDKDGNVVFSNGASFKNIQPDGKITDRFPGVDIGIGQLNNASFDKEGRLVGNLPFGASHPGLVALKPDGAGDSFKVNGEHEGLAISFAGVRFVADNFSSGVFWVDDTKNDRIVYTEFDEKLEKNLVTLSPDQTLLYVSSPHSRYIGCWQITQDNKLQHFQRYGYLHDLDDDGAQAKGMCVDTEGRLYVATKLGIQVFDQAGRVNFIITTPAQPDYICFGGKDLSTLYVGCGEAIYKRPTKVHGIVSGQMAPVKPEKPRL